MPNVANLPEFDPWVAGSVQFIEALEVGAFLMRRPPAWNSMSDAMIRFFGLPDDEKLRSVSAVGTLGYRRLGTENLAVDAGDADDAPVDRNESFAATWGSIADGGRKFVWPGPPEFRERWRSFHRESAALGDRLLSLLLAERVGRLPDVSAHMARAVCYPPGGAGQGLGAGTHTDFGWFSLIWADEDGLEVETRQGWRSVPASEDRIVAVLGDIAALSTGHRLRATVHRVRAPARVRHALIFFYNPDRDAIVAGPDISFETWLASKEIRRGLRRPPSTQEPLPGMVAGEHVSESAAP